jgi:uncharacterized membrane protein YesL
VRHSAVHGLVFVIVSLTLLVNLYFYGRYAGLTFRLLQIVFVYFLAIWFLMQLYIFPLLLEQEERSLRLAMRNAVILVLRHPDFSLVMGLMSLLWIGISAALTLPAIILLGSVLTLLGNRAVRALLSLYREDEADGLEDPGFQLDEDGGKRRHKT